MQSTRTITWPVIFWIMVPYLFKHKRFICWTWAFINFYCIIIFIFSVYRTGLYLYTQVLESKKVPQLRLTNLRSFFVHNCLKKKIFNICTKLTKEPVPTVPARSRSVLFLLSYACNNIHVFTHTDTRTRPPLTHRHYALRLWLDHSLFVFFFVFIWPFIVRNTKITIILFSLSCYGFHNTHLL